MSPVPTEGCQRTNFTERAAQCSGCLQSGCRDNGCQLCAAFFPACNIQRQDHSSEGGKAGSRHDGLFYNGSTQTYGIKADCGSAADVYNAGTKWGTNVSQYTANDTPAQNWHIEGNADGTVSFRSECNNLYMDVNNAETEDGNNVQVWRGNGTIAQKWTLV